MSNGHTPPRTPEQERREAAEKEAASYAWDYFQYHAGQRQSVFRFFLTLVGVLTLAYGYSLRSESSDAAAHSETVRLGIGCLLIVTSVLFWRLDKRSQNLIKASEDALKQVENRLASLLDGDQSIRLMHIDGHKSQSGLLSYVETFRQIYAVIFSLVGLSGGWIVARHFGLL